MCECQLRPDISVCIYFFLSPAGSPNFFSFVCQGGIYHDRVLFFSTHILYSKKIPDVEFYFHLYPLGNAGVETLVACSEIYTQTH